MFAIYGTSGQLFHGPLEALRRVDPSLRSARVRALNPALDRPVPETPSTPRHAADDALEPDAPRERQIAVASYAAIQQPVEPRHVLSTVQDLMSRPALCLREEASVSEAWQALAEAGCGQAPVVNAEQRLVGMLSRADLLRADRLPGPDESALVWRSLLLQPVSTLMETPVPAVAMEADVRRLASVLLDTGLPGLPVVDASGLVLGFVSRSDILRAVVHDPPLDLWS